MNATDKEELRHRTLEVLALREGSALTARKVLNRVAAEIDFAVSEADIIIALSFLIGLGHIASRTDDLGSTQYYQATPQGILAYERAQNPSRPRHD